ncbi:histone methyltransferase set1 [Rhodosporidiobolus nylandii]
MARRARSLGRPRRAIRLTAALARPVLPPLAFTSPALPSSLPLPPLTLSPRDPPPKAVNGHEPDRSSRSSRYEKEAPDGSSSSRRRPSLTSSEKHSPATNGTKPLPPPEAGPSRPSTSSSAAPRPRPSGFSHPTSSRPSSLLKNLPAFFYKSLGAKDFKVLYDPTLDPNPIKKGKEPVKRFDGEGLMEKVTDPRKTEDPAKKAELEKRRMRGGYMRELGVLSYSWDKNSTGPPPPAPPCAILVTNFPSATTADALHAHFRTFGRIEQLDIKTDVQTGGSLGICWIKFVDDVPRDAEPDKPTREKYERKRRAGQAQDGGSVAFQAVQKANGAKVGMAMLMGDVGVKVELDGDGVKCKAAVKAEMDRRHPPKKEVKKPPPTPAPSMSRTSSSSATPQPSAAPPSLPPPPPPPSTAPPPPPSRMPLPPQASAYIPGRGGRFGQPAAHSPAGVAAANAAAAAVAAKLAPQGPRGGRGSAFPTGPRSMSGAVSTANHVSVPSMVVPPLPSVSRAQIATHVSVPSVVIPPLPPARPVPTRRPSGTAPASHAHPRFGRRGAPRGMPGREANMASAIAQAVEAAKRRLKQQQAGGKVLSGKEAHAAKAKGGRKAVKEEGEEDDMEMDSADEAAKSAAEDDGSKSGSGVEGSGSGSGSGSEDEEVDAKDTIFFHHRSGRAEPRRILPRGIAPVGAIAWQASRKVLLEKLAANGKPYLKIDKTTFQQKRTAGGGRGAVPNAEELEKHFGEFEIDRTFADFEGWYITFKEATSAKDALDALNGEKFGGATLELLLCDPPVAVPAPSSTPLPAKPISPHPGARAPEPGTELAAIVEKLSRRPSQPKPKKTSGWTDAELVEEAKDIVISELLEAFQNDLKVRLVRGKVQEHLTRWERQNGPAPPAPPPAASASPALPPVPLEAVKTEAPDSPADSPIPPSGSAAPAVKSLSSLSFAKRKSSTGASHDDRRRRRGSTSTRMSSEAPSESPAPGVGSDADEPASRRKDRSHTKVRKEKKKSVRAYSSSEESSGDERAARRKKVEALAKKKKSASAARKARVSAAYTSSEDEADEVPKKLARVKEEEDSPATAGIVATPSPELEVKPSKHKNKRDQDAMDVDERSDSPAPHTGKLVRGRKPEPEKKVRQPIPMPTSLDPFDAGLAGDEEDLYYLKLALERLQLGQDLHPTPPPSDDESNPPPKHASGSARTEGFYTITVEEKMANRPASNRTKGAGENAAAANSAVAVSRLARANTRGLVRGMELHKKVTATDTDVLQFNQLKTRKKQLTFSRSGIEGYGLFAKEFIPKGDMVIEYVGELIRQQVADRREKAYERRGIGSSYLFRVDEDLVVDATVKGNLGRLINHCCAPNCTARIITINGVKKIVIYAKSNIEVGDEVTYDYHFPIEEDNKIPCLCGAPTCRRYLN